MFSSPNEYPQRAVSPPSGGYSVDAHSGASLDTTHFDELPDQMRRATRWLLHKQKIPFYASGRPRVAPLDGPEDRSSLCSLEAALDTLRSGAYDGLGFALGPDGTGNYWQGIDLDDLPGRPQLQHVADSLPGYTECSPSGRGMHAIGYGRPFNTLGPNGTGLEAYSAGRFFTVTGDKMGRYSPVDLAEFVEAVLRPVHGCGRTQEERDRPPGEVVDPKTISELRDALNAIPADDRDTWVRMGMALKTLAQGRGLWLTWSQNSPEKFDPIDAARRWESFEPRNTSFRAVFTEAQRLGWVNPMSNRARPVADYHLLPQQEGDTSEAESDFFLSAADLLREPAPIRYLVQGMIEHPSLAMLFGAPSAGKSFVALSWAAAVACGLPWFGRACIQGSVFYLAGEGHAGLARRLRAWTAHTGHDVAKAPLFVSKLPTALMDREGAEQVEHEIARRAAQVGDPALVIVDTLARNMGSGDENSNADIGTFVSHIDRLRHRLGCTVLIVHHTGHMDAGRARGGSALPAAMDSVFGLDHCGTVRKLIHKKSKESELTDEMQLVLREVPIGWLDAQGQEMTSAVMELADDAQASVRKKKPLTKRQKMALEAFCKAAAEDQLDADGRSRANIETWRTHFYLLSGLNSETRRKAFNRAQDDLVGLNVLRAHGDEYSIVEDDPGMIAADLVRNMAGTA